MKSLGTVRKLAAALTAASVFASSAASAAPATQSVDPLVALSVFGTASSKAAVTSSAAAATATGVPSAALPLAGSTAVAAQGGVYNDRRGGFAETWPIWVFGAGMAVLVLLEIMDDDDDFEFGPISPN